MRKTDKSEDLRLEYRRKDLGKYGRGIVEAYRKIGDPDDRFDIEFWQRQGDAAIFQAALEMIMDVQIISAAHADEPRIARDIECFSKR